MERAVRFIAVLLLIHPVATACGAEAVRVGAGGYLDGLPAGAKGPPVVVYRTDECRGPMPTCDWWSSLAWVPFSETMFPHPLALRATETGLRLFYPGSAISANGTGIFGASPGGDGDLIVGHSAVERFADARVAGWSDWFVTARFGEEAAGFRATFGHGSPYVYFDFKGGEPVVRLVRPPTLPAGAAAEAALFLKIDGRGYGLFAPSGSTWEGLGTARLTAKTKDKGYLSIALLPDDKPETFALFQRHAFAFVTNSLVSWRYDETRATVHTVFEFLTAAREGSETGSLFALYPHQWRRTDAALTGHAYASVRGPMKLAAGRSFAVATPLPPSLPSIPLTPSLDRGRIRETLSAELTDKPRLAGDTYWLGKALGKWATLRPLAEQAGDGAAAAECDRRLRTALENFFTATNAAGAPKTAGEGVFAYNRTWGTLIGYPASYGSDDQLNDHHFHYGYFIRAAGELARRDPDWASADRWGGVVRLLIRDIASADRDDPMFPFLRGLDPYAGHSWASGHAKFGDGNNNESSSEAANAWYGMLLLGEATGDRALRDLGAWLYATEVSGIEDYWFNVRGDLFPAAYPASVVTMVWGGKGANATWFSANPECVHGINWMPFTGGSLYLGGWPAYARKNYEALVRENLADDTAQAAKKNRPAPADGTRWDAWADLVWMYRALSDPEAAWKQFESRPPDFKPEAGNSMAHACAWIAAFRSFGTLDRSVTADAPFAAVFVKDGRRTRVAWNIGRRPRTVTFSDGVKLDCAPGTLAVE